MEQRSEEWYNQKLGKFSASDIVRLCGAKGLGQTGLSYIYEKGSEILTGINKDIGDFKSLEWGRMHEPIASEYYEAIHGFECGELLKEVGFIEYSKYSGCSPDRIYIGNSKGIEIKCPITTEAHYKHLLIKNQKELKLLKSGSQTGKYYWQIQKCMLVLDFEVWDFVSFHPHFTGKNRMKILEVERDEKDIQLLKNRISEAESILIEQLEYLNK
jgi:hypothetical protein